MRHSFIANFTPHNRRFFLSYFDIHRSISLASLFILENRKKKYAQKIYCLLQPIEQMLLSQDDLTISR